MPLADRTSDRPFDVGKSESEFHRKYNGYAVRRKAFDSGDILFVNTPLRSSRFVLHLRRLEPLVEHLLFPTARLKQARNNTAFVACAPLFGDLGGVRIGG
jgi:hypothetical protein